MGTLPWASGGGSGDGTEVGVLLDDEWVPRADRNPTPGVPCMLPLGLEAPGGTRKGGPAGYRGRAEQNGHRACAFEYILFQGPQVAPKSTLPVAPSLNQALGRTRAYENSI